LAVDRYLSKESIETECCWFTAIILATGEQRWGILAFEDSLSKTVHWTLSQTMAAAVVHAYHPSNIRD
jgi:hypothetical protein